jgi:hypothetical protein
MRQQDRGYPRARGGVTGLDFPKLTAEYLRIVYMDNYVALRRVKEIRDHCRKISDSYFSNLEEFIKKKMGKITSE